MRHIKILLVLLLLMLSSVANAAFPVSQQCTKGKTGFPTYFRTASTCFAAANASFMAMYTAGVTAGFHNPVEPCTPESCSSAYGMIYDGGFSSGCLVNSTESGGQCTCSSGFSQSGSSCVPYVNLCTGKKDTVVIINRTVMYSRTSAENDWAAVGPVTQTPPGTSVCEAGCSVKTDPATASTPGVNAWVSLVPTPQGLYRHSLDLPATHSGLECSAASGTSDAPNNPATPAPLCPGFVGDVNGVKGCFGTADKPVITTDGGRPPVPASSGNPAAGTKPASGEGSGSTGAGRTPAAGTGGNDGGPAGSAAGPTGNSPASPAGEQQAACGAPGQPRCRIDETGVPGPFAANEFKAQADKYKTDTDAVRGTVSGTGDKQFFGGWSAAFLAPPIAACEPFQLPSFKALPMGSIDPCPVADGMRLVMAWIWAVGGLVLCLGMIKKVV